MLLLVSAIFFTIFVFIIMWKATSVAVKITKDEYDSAHKEARNVAIMTGIVCGIALLIIAFTLYMKFSPSGRVASSQAVLSKLL